MSTQIDVFRAFMVGLLHVNSAAFPFLEGIKNVPISTKFPPVYLTELRACQSHSSLDIVPQILVGVKVLSRQADYDAFEVICILSLKFVLFTISSVRKCLILLFLALIGL